MLEKVDKSLKVKRCKELTIDTFNNVLSLLEIDSVTKLTLSHCRLKQLKAHCIGQLKVLNNSVIMSSSIVSLLHL